MQPLTNAKHEHFCQLVSNGESATQAYIIAGYSENGAKQGANRLLTHVDVCSRIDFLRKQKEQMHSEVVSKVIEEAGITKEWIISELVENVRIAKAAEPVLDHEGNPTGEYRANIPAANKALELLGSELGMFTKKVESGKPGDFDKLNDDELDRSIEEASRAIESARTKAKTSDAAQGAPKKAERKQAG
jgi:hypothetical protein